METAIKTLSAIFGAVMGLVFGGFDIMLNTLLWFTLIDLITGFWYAKEKKIIQSRPIRKGVFNKTKHFIIIFIAYRLDQVWGLNVLRDAAVSMYLVHEAISIVENLYKMGAPLPTKVVELLEIFKPSTVRRNEENDQDHSPFRGR